MANSSILSLSMSVSGGNLTKKHLINIELDFTNIDNSVILQWAADNRIIALQRVLRATDDGYITSLGGKLSVHATACGSKLETPTERIAKLIAAGMPPMLANLAVTDPTKFDELMGSLGK